MTAKDDFWAVRSIPDSPSWPFFRGRFLARYQFVGSRVAGRRVLDVASGAGYGSWLLATEAGAREVVGVEIDAAAVRYAEAHFNAPNLSFLHADGRTVACHFARESFDVVSSMGTLEHVPAPGQFASAVATVLDRRGVWLVTMLNPSLHHDPDPFHEQEWDDRAFRSFLEEYFREVTILGLQQKSSPVAATPAAKLKACIPASWKRAVAQNLSPAWQWRVRLAGEKMRESADYTWCEEGLDRALEYLAICEGPRA